MYWRTASAVPWNHSLLTGDWEAASTSTKPLELREPSVELYACDRWRFSEAELNCVRQ